MDSNTLKSVVAHAGFDRRPLPEDAAHAAASTRGRVRRVLVLVDLAARGERAIRHARRISLESGAGLLAVHVIDGRVHFELDRPCDAPLAMALFGRGVPRASRRLDLMLARNGAAWAESRVLVGDDARALQALIGRWKPDLVVADARSARAHWATSALAGCRVELIDRKNEASPIARRIFEILKGEEKVVAEASATAGIGSRRLLVRALGLGVATLLLYMLLFANETAVLRYTGQGHWHFLLPVVIAFVFSFFHGAFTAKFWDVLGVKASGKRG